jgi:D-galactarolactone cycloisomerase
LADGLLEVDVNPNPLRSLTLAGMPPLRDGVLQLGVEPGIGPALSLESLAGFLVAC